MLEFDAQAFVGAYGALSESEHLLKRGAPFEDTLVSSDDAKALQPEMDKISQQCWSLQLLRSVDQVGRIKNTLRGTQCTTGKLVALYGDLRNRMFDELKARICLTINEAEAPLYREDLPFGTEAANKFPLLLVDSQEAAKCLALDRGTACVFHLMRVMEGGLQYLGKKLGVRFTEEKVWQVILDQVNRIVKTIPSKTSKQKTRQALFAATASNLFSVKLAWRNPVMHPKATYTPNEARDVYTKVESFMRHLASIL